jgi:hypothetical protein
VPKVLGKGLQWYCDCPVDIAVLTTEAEAWLLILTQLILRFFFQKGQDSILPCRRIFTKKSRGGKSVLLSDQGTEPGVPTPLPENDTNAMDHHTKIISEVWSLRRPSLLLFWVEESKGTTTNVILIILTPVPCIFYFVLWPTNAQLFNKLSHDSLDTIFSSSMSL